MERMEQHRCFGGVQEVWEHESDVLSCTMKFGIFLPEQVEQGSRPALYFLSGLTCSEQNFITKSGAQRYAAEHGLVLIAPDTSPRGDDVPDWDDWDMGKGAGFYVDATQEPWSAHYQMGSYITRELPQLIAKHFNVSGKRSVCGHSMGGHGALVLALRNPGMFESVSAFSPIVAPCQVPWGEQAFSAYLGEDRQAWKAWDARELVLKGESKQELLVEQGGADAFLDAQLKPELLEQACEQMGHPLTLNVRAGHDHSYYFVSSFIGEHIAYHARALGLSQQA